MQRRPLWKPSEAAGEPTLDCSVFKSQEHD